MGQQEEELTPDQVVKQYVKGLEIINEQREKVEQLRVQLAGCSVAALGGTYPEGCRVAQKGDFGWSPTYQDVLGLRVAYDELIDAVHACQGLIKKQQAELEEMGDVRSLAGSTELNLRVVRQVSDQLYTALYRGEGEKR